MVENCVEVNVYNVGGCLVFNVIYGYINDFLVCIGLRSGVSELQLLCFMVVRVEIVLMFGSVFVVMYYFVSS